MTLYGIPGRHHDKLPDNSLDALKAWEAKEDSWLAQIKQTDPATIDAAPLRGTYAIVREALEGSAGKRVCRDEVSTRIRPRRKAAWRPSPPRFTK